jgi:hypothetical protein
LSGGFSHRQERALAKTSEAASMAAEGRSCAGREEAHVAVARATEFE